MSDDNAYSSSLPIVKEKAEASAPNDRAPERVRPTLRLSLESASPSSVSGSLTAPEAKDPQNMRAEPTAQLLALADLIESWGAALPRWDSQVVEPWFVFVERAYKAETDLAERLRRLPTCRIFMCPVRENVSLTLAGIRVETDKGLAAVCRAWAREARAHGRS